MLYTKWGVSRDAELRKISMISKTSRPFKPTKATIPVAHLPRRVATFNFHETRDHASPLEQPHLKRQRNSSKSYDGILLRGKSGSVILPAPPYLSPQKRSVWKGNMAILANDKKTRSRSLIEAFADRDWKEPNQLAKWKFRVPWSRSYIHNCLIPDLFKLQFIIIYN